MHFGFIAPLHDPGAPADVMSLLTFVTGELKVGPMIFAVGKLINGVRKSCDALQRMGNYARDCRVYELEVVLE